MTDEINDGGPAFPINDHASWNKGVGMSLRDYFAATAMQGRCKGCWRTLPLSILKPLYMHTLRIVSLTPCLPSGRR